MMSCGCRFTNAEIDSLLDDVEGLLPIGPNDWERVVELHCLYCSGLGCMHDSLMHKFASLYNHS